MPIDVQKFSSIHRPIKRSVVISGHSTSFTLEENFWKLLQRYASYHKISVASVVAQIDSVRTTKLTIDAGLSCIIRQFILLECLKNPNIFVDIL